MRASRPRNPRIHIFDIPSRATNIDPQQQSRYQPYPTTFDQDEALQPSSPRSSSPSSRQELYISTPEEKEIYDMDRGQTCKLSSTVNIMVLRSIADRTDTIGVHVHHMLDPMNVLLIIKQLFDTTHPTPCSNISRSRVTCYSLVFYRAFLVISSCGVALGCLMALGDV